MAPFPAQSGLWLEPGGPEYGRLLAEPSVEPEAEDLPETVTVCEGQLSFGPQQGILSEAETPPQQLALLPDPPPWEVDLDREPLVLSREIQKGRMARKHSRRGTSPGQSSLF